MATLDCDVSSRLFTLHYCTIVAVAKSDTAAHMGRGDVLYQLTDGPSNDIHTNRLSPYRYLHDRWPQLEPGRHVGRAVPARITNKTIIIKRETLSMLL